MADLRAYIANCLIHGEKLTRRGKQVVRDTVTFTCDGRKFILTQRPEIVANPVKNFNNKFCETTEIVVPDVTQDQVVEVLKTVNRVCWLLSFACQSHVLCYGHSYPDGSQHKTIQSVVGIGNYFRPVFEIADGAAIRDFIDQAYPTYAALESTRQLNVAIDYMLQAERSGLPTECRLIFVFVMLENLKHSYATCKGIPFIDGFFRVSAKPKAKTIGFQKLLEMMLNEVNMSTQLNAIIGLRNDVIHSGLSSKSHTEQRALYDQVHDVIREYMLRLLKFKGAFYVYSNAGDSQMTI